MTPARSSKGLGQRLAKYRKLAGLSAQQLSDRVGGEMSRSVIANIESGRKSDVTIDQLLALAWALDVSPVALAISTESPFEKIQIVEGDGGAVLPVYDLAAWFTNILSADKLTSGPTGVEQAGSPIADMTVVVSGEFSYQMSMLRLLERKAATGEPVPREKVEELRGQFEESLDYMRRARMDIELAMSDSQWEVRLNALSQSAGLDDGDDGDD